MLACPLRKVLFSLRGFRKAIGTGTQTPSGDGVEVTFSELSPDKDVFLHLRMNRHCLESGEPFCQQVLAQFFASGLFKGVRGRRPVEVEGS